MTAIHVIAYAEKLLQDMAAGANYLEALEATAQTAFANEPWGARAIRTAVRGSTPPPGIDLTASLRASAACGMESVAETELERLVGLADPQMGSVECHLFPCMDPDRRGGFCYAPGKILLQMPLMEHWPVRVVRNIAHEYSHTLRSRLWPTDERFGYGPAYRYTIREFLVFEGLANNLADESHPHPAFPAPEVAPELARRYWEAVSPHMHLEHWDAYGIFLQPDPELPSGIGYSMGEKLIRVFLDDANISALAAHRFSYEEILQAIGQRDASVL